MKKVLFVSFLFLLLLFGCLQQINDDLNRVNLQKYTGTYLFTILRHDQFWLSNIDTTYTKIFEGEISLYKGDLINAYRRLSIDFGRIITPEVLSSGVFVTQPDIHEQLTGKFTSNDEVTFVLWQNSNGFSIKQNVTGKRK